MQGIHLRKYGVEAKIPFVLYEVDGVDLRVDAADGGTDCALTKDEGAETTCTNDFVDEGSGYSITITNTEMEAARISVYIIDSATKVWLDEVLIIETYGNASAQHSMDFDDADGSTLTEVGGDGAQLTTCATATGFSTAAVVGALADVTAAGDPTEADTLMQYVKQLINTLEGTIGIPAWPAAAAPANSVSLAEAIRGLYEDRALAAADYTIVADLGVVQSADNDTKLDAVIADTEDIQARLPAALSGTNLKADVLAISTSTDAADKLEASAETIVLGTQSDDNTAASTTVFHASDITEATADHYKGRIIIFTTGDLTGQATDITAYELDTGEGQFTVTALTEAPGDNDTFVIV